MANTKMARIALPEFRIPPDHVGKGELVGLDAANFALTRADTLDEIKLIRVKAEAVRKYAQSAALGLDAQNRAAEVRLRAERKAGQMLASLNLRGGDRRSKNYADSLKLEDLGISKNQSTRWQLQAQLSDSEFEEYLRTKREAGGEIVAADVLRLARKARKETIRESGLPLGGCGAAAVESSRSSSRSSLPQPSEVLSELKQHRNQLDDILRPFCLGESSALQTAEGPMLAHLLDRIRVLLDQLSGGCASHTKGECA